MKLKNNESTTMAISNCLFSPTTENPRDFQFGACLQSLALNHATTHSPNRCHQFEK